MPCLLEHNTVVCVKKQKNKRKTGVFHPCLSHSAITSLRDPRSSSSTDLESKPSILVDWRLIKVMELCKVDSIVGRR